MDYTYSINIKCNIEWDTEQQISQIDNMHDKSINDFLDLAVDDIQDVISKKCVNITSQYDIEECSVDDFEWSIHGYNPLPDCVKITCNIFAQKELNKGIIMQIANDIGDCLEGFTFKNYIEKVVEISAATYWEPSDYDTIKIGATMVLEVDNINVDDDETIDIEIDDM